MRLLLLSPLIQTFGHFRALLLIGTFRWLEITSRDVLIMVIDDEVKNLNLVVCIELGSQCAVRKKLRNVRWIQDELKRRVKRTWQSLVNQ